MERILLLGCSGHASVVYDSIVSMGIYQVVGIIAPDIASGTSIWGLPVLGGDDDIPRIAEEFEVEGFCVGVGDNLLRRTIVQHVKKIASTLRFVTAIHSRASVSPRANLGDGTCVMPGAVVNAGCSVAEGCVVNTGATIDHDTILRPYVSIAPGAHIGGNCEVGTQSFVGIGAAVIQGCRIGSDTVVAAGSVVIAEVEANSVYCGVPAKFLKPRVPSDRYL